MNKIVMSGIVAAAGLVASAQAQTQYTFQMRLIADGDAGAPTGLGTAYNIGDASNVQASRIGFWLQARVSQTGGQNWGVQRASSPAGGTSASFISVSDPAGSSALSRGSVNAANNQYGRGAGYRNGGTSTGNTGNAAGSLPFPSGTNNQNGGLDNGGAGAVTTRVYGFDAYTGSIRSDPDADGDGTYHNPWNVNGTTNPDIANSDPTPVALGTFSPWANLYRVWIDVGALTSVRTVTLNASALLNGSAQTQDVGGGSFPMQLGAGQTLTASYTFTVAPTPGAAAMLGLGGLAAMRRRR